MANIKSSMKRIKIANTRTLQNKSIKSGLEVPLKKLETAISEGDLDKARTLYPEVSSKLDKSCCKGRTHKNAAARKKSKLALKLKMAQE